MTGALRDLLMACIPCPVYKHLTEKYGGSWKYDGHHTWNCDDTKRRVTRTAGCSCDDDCDHPPNYWLYESGETPIRVF